ANRKALEAIPEVYHHPNDAADSTQSAYYVVVGAATAFPPKGFTRLADITDGPSRTLMVVESRSKEPWTKPVDVSYSEAATVPLFGGFTRDGFLCVTCDGAVHFVSHRVSADNLRAFLTRNKSDVVNIVGVPFRLDGK